MTPQGVGLWHDVSAVIKDGKWQRMAVDAVEVASDKMRTASALRRI